MKLAFLLVVAALTLTPAPSQGQTSAPARTSPRHAVVAALAFPPSASRTQETSGRVEPGTRGFVTLRDGDAVQAGALLALTPESVALLVGATTWTYPLVQVVRVERLGDSRLNGAVKGALVGGVCIVTCAQGARNGRHLTQLVFTNAAFGAAIGWWIDHKRTGRTTIYPVTSDGRDRPRR